MNGYGIDPHGARGINADVGTNLRRALAFAALGGLAACSGGASPPSSPSTTNGSGGTTVVSGAGGTSAEGGARGSGGSAGSNGTGGAPTTPGTGGSAAGTGGAPATDAGARDAGIPDAGAPTRAPAPPARAPTRAVGPTTCNLGGAATAQTPRVYVIGDSTASLYTADLFPRMGWAQPFQDFFTPACATIVDKALSGRSSKSFFDEGAWTPVRDALRAGDIVLIQFGHNDEKSAEPTLFTDPFTTYEQYLSIYIDDSRAKGATPILLTSINRNSWTNGVLRDTHGNYPVAVRQLAVAKQVTLVDMTALTAAYFNRIGQTATTLLFMDLAPGQFPNYPAGNVDDTHLQEIGARRIGQMTLADMYRQAFPVAYLLKAVPKAP